MYQSLVISYLLLIIISKPCCEYFLALPKELIQRANDRLTSENIFKNFHFVNVYQIYISTLFTTLEWVQLLLHRDVWRDAYLLALNFVSTFDRRHMDKVFQYRSVRGHSDACTDKNRNVILIPVLLPGPVRSVEEKLKYKTRKLVSLKIIIIIKYIL